MACEICGAKFGECHCVISSTTGYKTPTVEDQLRSELASVKAERDALQKRVTELEFSENCNNCKHVITKAVFNCPGSADGKTCFEPKKKERGDG